MTRSERPETRKSFTAAFIAGLLGYFFGWWLESNWASYISFFVLGYIGYEFRRVVAVTKSVINDYSANPDLCPFAPYPKLSFLVGVIGAFYGVATMGCEENPANLVHPFVCIKAAWTWVITNHNSMSNAPGVYYNTQQIWVGSQGQVDRLGMFLFFLVATTTIGFILGYNISALVSSGVKHHRQLVARTITFLRQHWLKMLLSPIWAVVSCIITPFVLMSRILLGILLGIHTFRRLATATATVGAGVIYLVFVPFSVGLPIALTSIGCGLTCGAVAWIVAYLLDGERAKVWLKTHLFAPFVNAFPPLDFGLARKSV